MPLRQFRFEEELKKFQGVSRLERLRSYYFTYKLPRQPENDQLHQAILELLGLRKKLGVSSSTEQSGASLAENLTASSLELKFKQFSNLSGQDKEIVGHCLAHCHVMEEIEHELQK